MADTNIEVVSDLNDLPGGLVPENGVSQDEAADGLFDLLGSEEEFSEEPGEEEVADLDDEEEVDADDLLDDEDEEDDLEDEEDDLDESDDGENDDEEVEALYEVTLPGGEKAEVTLDELRAGYSRTEDYTRKRQRDAAEHAEMLAETRGKRDAYVEGLERLEATLRELGPKKPDAALRQQNPGEYAAQMTEWQAYEDSINQVGQAKGAVQQEISAEDMEVARAHVQQEWEKVVTAVPEWSDEAVAVEALAKLKAFGMDIYNFTEPELDSLSDARLLLMLKENYDLKQTRSKGKKEVEKKRKTSKRLGAGSAKSPGTRKRGPRKAQRAANARAAQTGGVMDAARAIELALAVEEG